ncbi:MAG: Non-canonical purine NTP pyrophosphatase [Verrucomicrobia subdivision 3 bacterium]|nr:Non-canonical purine NTP pyrophosphatase [Limisphaerales bacterium]MCS1413429.1 Non-canonical purine NTP pyrophosphatase [Limisphaerales bacterium]
MSSLLIVATSNAHKIKEISQIIGSEFRCIGMRELGQIPELIECGDTFEANATSKVEQLNRWLEQNSEPRAILKSHSEILLLADDSGLEVDALSGAPGVRSARFAATEESTGNASDQANNEKLLTLLEDTPDEKRTARFRCVLALLAYPTESAAQLFSGSCEGRIASDCQGSGGFGYDPLFYPVGHSLSFAQIGSETKNKISHRAQALTQLKNYLATEGGAS